jgi:hypothetical protein
MLYRADPQDPFRRHRMALSIVAAETSADVNRVMREVSASEGASFVDFLTEYGLAAYWHNRVASQDVAGAPPGFMGALKRGRLAEAALYLHQRSALRELDVLFSSENIIYAVMKGAHVRELVYADPAVRPANDIDILVSPDQRESAARALIRAGFELHANAETLSHEVSLTRGSLMIDLHWDILRPGRTRIDMVPPMLSRRKRIYDFWGLDDIDTVFLMLVHPAFTKYICSPNMGLIRVVDFVLWSRKHSVDWDRVAERLHATGLKTAGWAVLQWFAMVLECVPVPEAFLDGIFPKLWRARYLRYWLENNLPTRWLDSPRLVQLGLTLLLHDRPSDAQRALRGWMQVFRAQGSDMWIQPSGCPGSGPRAKRHWALGR